MCLWRRHTSSCEPKPVCSAPAEPAPSPFTLSTARDASDAVSDDAILDDDTTDDTIDDTKYRNDHTAHTGRTSHDDGGGSSHDHHNGSSHDHHGGSSQDRGGDANDDVPDNFLTTGPDSFLTADTTAIPTTNPTATDRYHMGHREYPTVRVRAHPATAPTGTPTAIPTAAIPMLDSTAYPTTVPTAHPVTNTTAIPTIDSTAYVTTIPTDYPTTSDHRGITASTPMVTETTSPRPPYSSSRGPGTEDTPVDVAPRPAPGSTYQQGIIIGTAAIIGLIVVLVGVSGVAGGCKTPKRKQRQHLTTRIPPQIAETSFGAAAAPAVLPPVGRDNRFADVPEDAWQKNLILAAESAFGRLKQHNKADGPTRTASIISRIHDGVSDDDMTQAGSRECFLVKRAANSKSRFQVQVGPIRMVAQKVIYLAYHRVPAAEADSTQIQQNCCYPDGSWWCTEPSHLERTLKNHVSPNVVKHVIPRAADAELPLLRRAREITKRGDAAVVKRTAAGKGKGRASLKAGKAAVNSLGPTLGMGEQQLAQQLQLHPPQNLGFLPFPGGAQLYGDQHMMYNHLDPQLAEGMAFWSQTTMQAAQNGGPVTASSMSMQPRQHAHTMAMHAGYPGQMQFQYLPPPPHTRRTANPQQQMAAQQQQQQQQLQMYASSHPGATAQMHAQAEEAQAQAQTREQQARPPAAHSHVQPLATQPSATAQAANRPGASSNAGRWHDAAMAMAAVAPREHGAHGELDLAALLYDFTGGVAN